MKQQKKDDAVSPVVGVMLMLTITVLLAGVFAAAASGLFSGAADKPVDAEFAYLNSDGGHYFFEMTAGDAFSKDRLELVLSLRDDMSNQIRVAGKNILSSSGSNVRLGDMLQADKHGFAAAGKYVVWMFYDTKSGKLLSSGEIYQKE
ncbi:MAG TPA: type IV pilin N-terminal domain-containing protein [Methanocorpusculum sp.]|nr:type IV pilin N-terminal domain-containing protein [Methanocorpusculum sp.]